MTFSLKPDPKPVLRRRAKIKAELSRLAAAHDKAGHTTAPITLECTYVDLCKLGLAPFQHGEFLYQAHPVRAA